MKKRLIGLIAAMIMLVSLLAVSASAATSEVVITVGSVSGKQGDIVEVPVTISGNSYLVNTDIHIRFDTTKLKLVEYYADPDGDEGDQVCYSVENTVLDSSWMYMGNEKTSGDFMFVAATGKDTGMTAGGELFRLAFEIVAEDGTVPLIFSADPMNGNDGSGELDADGYPADYAITPSVVNGKITVEVENALGDLTNDGFVNMMDVMMLYNGASGKITLTDAQKAVADLTGDGIVNMMDAMALYNQLSGK